MRKKNLKFQFSKLLFIVVTGIMGTCFSQTKNDTIVAFQYYQQADSLLTKKEYKESIVLFEKALDIYSKISGKESKTVGKIYNKLGNSYKTMRVYETALNYYNKYLKFLINNIDSNPINVAKIYSSIGRVYYRMKQLDIALEYYEKALVIYKKENDDVLLSDIYLNIGVLLLYKDENNKAVKYCEKSLDLAKKIYTHDHPKIATLNNALSYIYNRLGDNEKSLFHNNKSLQAYEKTYGKNHILVSNCHDMKGSIYSDMKEYDKALVYFTRALKTRQKSPIKNFSNIERSYRNIAILYRMQGIYNKALENYQKSLKMLEELPETNFDLIVDNCIDMGAIYFKQKKYDESLLYYDKAIYMNTRKEFLGRTTLDHLRFNHYHLMPQLLDAISGKAITLQECYNMHKSTSFLVESTLLYQNLDRLIDHLRESYQGRQDKLYLARRAKDIYNDGIKAYLLKFKVDNSSIDLEKARYYAEKSKSNTLKKLLLDHSAKNFSQLPEEVLKLESILKSNHAYYLSRIASEYTKDSIDTLIIQGYEGKLFDVTRRQDSLTIVLEQEYPKYYQLKHDAKVISVSEIQEKLDDNTTLLEFSISDSITYAYTITKNKFDIQELQTLDIDSKIETFRNLIISKNISEYKKVSSELYSTLIEPIKNKLEGNTLIIIPDGALWHLNFDLLLTKDVNSETPNELPYLLREYAIVYANSATLYFNPLKQNKQNKQQQAVLAFSFSDSTSVLKSKNISLSALRDTGDDLPGTRKEIKAIANIIDGQYFFGIDADEANFKKYANEYKILHLALHGDVDNKQPENSKLYFTKSKDTIEDSYLYGHELFALSIPAELTVLSACNTGTGKIAKGEGIMSLGHAFQYAGTKSLLLSGWEVPDETTPKLMSYFYTNLKNGMNKAKALQQAKLKCIEQADIYKAAPFYWGGFYLVGDIAPIDFKTNYTWYWIIGLVLLSLLIFTMSLYHKRKSVY